MPPHAFRQSGPMANIDAALELGASQVRSMPHRKPLGCLLYVSPRRTARPTVRGAILQIWAPPWPLLPSFLLPFTHTSFSKLRVTNSGVSVERVDACRRGFQDVPVGARRQQALPLRSVIVPNPCIAGQLLK